MTSTIDIIVIIGYFLMLIAIGYFCSRNKVSGAEDYLVAGRDLNLPMFVAVVAAVAIGGGVTMGGCELAYLYGVSSLWRGGSVALSIFLLAFLISTKLSKMRVYTTNEVLGIFYGKHARLMGAVVSFVYLLMICVLQIVSIGTVLSIIGGFSFTTSMIIGAVIIVCYLLFGGMLAVTRIDTIQFIVMTVGVIFLTPFFALRDTGGLDAVISAVPPEYFQAGNLGMDRIIAQICAFVPGFMIGQDIWQRCFTARNAKIQKKGIILAAIYILIYCIASVFAGMALFSVNPNLETTSYAFSTAIATFVPAGLRGLVLVALVAAIMSSANGAILGASATLYEDMIKPFSKKERTQKQEVSFLRLLSALVILVSVIFAVGMQSILGAMDVAYAYLSGCMFVPMVCGLMLKKCSARSGLYAIIVSFIVVTVFIFKDGISASTPIIYGIIVNAIVFFVVYAIDKNKVEVELGVTETVTAEAE